MLLFPQSTVLRFLSFLLLCLLILVPVSGNSVLAQERQDERSRLYAQFTRGYEAIAEDPEKAISIFEEIVRGHSTNITARRQLGSLYVGAGRFEDALEQFRVVDVLFPSDTTKLQIAYLLASLSRYEEARSTFQLLSSSANRDMRERASAAVAVLGWTIRDNAYPWWGRISGDPYYDSRFNNSVFRFRIMGGAYLTESKNLSAYAVGLFTRDTRSSGGAVPVVYSDSYSLIGGGFRIHPFRGATIDLQGGIAIDLLDRPQEPAARGDLRALASYGWGLYPVPASPEQMQLTFKPFVEAMAMGGYYSRYRNVLGFGHAKTGARVLEWWRSYVDLYVRADLVADTQREFYNNIMEGSLGLRIIPDFGWGLQILAEFHRGLYWDTSLPTAPYDRWYSSGRFYIVIDQPFGPICF
jgi:tetratricopeptide (TPR) repeat protein